MALSCSRCGAAETHHELRPEAMREEQSQAVLCGPSGQRVPDPKEIQSRARPAVNRGISVLYNKKSGMPVRRELTSPVATLT